MVASSAVMSRTRMRALPESEGGTEGLTTESTEDTEERIRPNELRQIEFILRFISEAGLIGVEGDEAAHGDGALSDEALDRGEIARRRIPQAFVYIVNVKGCATIDGCDFFGGFGVYHSNSNKDAEGEAVCRGP